jgi:anti-sigma regulatory factor (Ser/Thr protein kinase)
MATPIPCPNAGTDSITFSVRAETHVMTLRALRRMIVQSAEFCGASQAAVTDLEIAVGEILSNVRRHAYRGGAGLVEVHVRCGEHATEIVVHDHGAPVVRAPQVPLVRPAALDVDGVGLYLTGQVVDSVEISHPAHDEHGTSVRLLKRF